MLKLGLNFIKRYWMVFSLFNLFLVTVLSLTPAEMSVPGNDKIQHIIAYASIIFPCVLSQYRHWVILSFLCVIWSGAIELIQPFTNRYGDWTDLVANSIGVLMGIIFAKLINYFLVSQKTL
jgi:VanZ family protein